ncbi:MAG: DUF3019 domain-containing protein [Agarilytica sp.]
MQLFAAFLLQAVHVYADEMLPLIQFSIKPSICVLSGGEKVCEDDLALKWESSGPRSLCLFRHDTTIPLRCWEEENQGEHLLSISASRNVDFQLRETKDKKVLVTEAFEVVKDNTQFRRRRRNAWSFF